MRKNEVGQAFILILIILAIGAMLVVPLLRLSYTVVKGNQTLTNQTRALYAAEGAQEYVMWKLLHKDWAKSFTNPGQEGYLTIENCGITMEATVIMRAIPGQGGLDLALEDKIIQPTKTVSPSVGNKNQSLPVTYIIKLDHLSNDTSEPLEAIFDLLPQKGGQYQPGSTYVRIDGGEWQQADDPNLSKYASSGYIFWPNTYNKDTGLGGFSSYIPNPDGFHGIEIFDAAQINELKFDWTRSYNQDGVYCNWVVIKPWNTASGPQAPVAIGDQPFPYTCDSGNNIPITKTAFPTFISPGVETPVRYTVVLSNEFGSERGLAYIIDYLPEGFVYAGNLMATLAGVPLAMGDPEGLDEKVDINGSLRYELIWDAGDGELSFIDEFPGWNEQIGAGDILEFSFDVLATKDVSGSYYNELIAQLKSTGAGTLSALIDIGLTVTDLYENYSWNQGSVTVPTYDSEVDGEGITLDENLSLVVDGISITSFNIR